MGGRYCTVPRILVDKFSRYIYIFAFEMTPQRPGGITGIWFSGTNSSYRRQETDSDGNSYTGVAEPEH